MQGLGQCFIALPGFVYRFTHLNEMNLEGIEKRLTAIEQVLGNIAQKMGPGSANDRIGGVQLAIELTGYSERTIYVKARKGEIPFKKRGGKLFFSETELRAWMTSTEVVDIVKIVAQNKRRRTRPSLIDTIQS